MISVRIHFHGAIDRKGHCQDHLRSCDGPITIQALLEALGYGPQERKVIVPLLAGERKPLGHVLHDGDELVVMAPAGGG